MGRLAQQLIQAGGAWLLCLAIPGGGARTCSILVYRRFGVAATDSMTTANAVFPAQTGQLRARGYRIATLALPRPLIVDAVGVQGTLSRLARGPACGP